MKKLINEVYMCLYCNAKFIGDNAWLEHLRSEKHGAAEVARGFDATIPDARIDRKDNGL